jgi:uncharacterized protein
MAVMAHVGALLAGFLVPLVIYASAKDQFTRRHAAEALNWQLTLLGIIVIFMVPFMAMPFAFPLLATSSTEDPGVFFGAFAGFFAGMFALMGLMLVIMVVNLIFVITATMRASRREDYRYPLTIRLVKP